MTRTELPPGIGKSVAVFSMVRPSERALLDARAVEVQRSRSSVIRSAILAYLRTCVIGEDVTGQQQPVVMATGGGPIEGEDDG